MRIGMFADYALPHIGGVETSMYNQQKALRAAGHEVFIISPPMRGAGTVEGGAENYLRIKSPVRISFDAMDIYYYHRQLFKKLDSLKIDLIHVQSEFSFGSTALRYGRSRGLPCIYTAHTFYPPQIESYMKFPKTMAVLSEASQKVFLRGLGTDIRIRHADDLYGIPCHTWAQRRILAYWMRFASATDAILAPSQRMLDYVHHFVKGKPYFLIPNPVDSSVVDKATVMPASLPIKIMSASVMRPEKRPEVIIEAVAMLTPEERSSLRLEMYSGGILIKQMKKLVKKNGLERTVHFMGSVHNNTLHQAMTKNDVVVTASLGFDNQPMVILEAIHAGCAVMLCDEYLREGTDGGNSLLVEPGPEAFAEGIRWLINNPEKLTRMKKASKRLSREFTYQTFVRNYEQVLLDLGIQPR